MKKRILTVKKVSVKGNETAKAKAKTVVDEEVLTVKKVSVKGNETAMAKAA